MKYVVLIALLLAGCENGYEEREFPKKPPELEDCKFYRLSNDKGGEINVARCPLSSTTTTYNVGKTTHSSIVIDDGLIKIPVENVEKPVDSCK